MPADIEEQYDRIYRYCYFRLKRRETAEDITQETFLRFWQNKACLRAGETLPYLYTIARNLCIDEYRRQSAAPPAADIPPEALAEQTALGASDGQEGRLLQRLSLQTALERLDPEEREMLLLRYANELPVSAISALFRISRFAVRRRINGALRRLRQNLNEEDFL